VPELPVYKLFPLLFMMTGPLRVVPAFTVLTENLGASERNRLALRAVIFASIGVILSLFVGVGLLKSWSVSPEALAAATGVLLFLTALWSVMGWTSGEQPTAPVDPNPRLAISPLAFPTILPPFAVGVLILFGAFFPNLQEQAKILALALAMLLVDLVAMRYARQIMAALGPNTLQVLGAVFGVMQLALAIEMIFWSVDSTFTPA
jgi:multiple antibiotic resistance protein